MSLILIFFTFFAPRLVIAILWFFSQWFNGIFTTWLIPVLGFIFTPYTLLWYTVVQNWYGGIWGMWQIIFMVIALLLDLSQLRKKHE